MTTPETPGAGCAKTDALKGEVELLRHALKENATINECRGGDTVDEDTCCVSHLAYLDAEKELTALRTALAEKIIEADTMRQHHKNAEAALTASNQQREELERAFEWLLTNFKATLQAIAISHGRRNYEIDRFVDDNLAVREATSALTRIRANRTTA